MKREAVQEERQRTKDSEDNEVESTSNSHMVDSSQLDRLVGHQNHQTLGKGGSGSLVTLNDAAVVASGLGGKQIENGGVLPPTSLQPSSQQIMHHPHSIAPGLMTNNSNNSQLQVHNNLNINDNTNSLRMDVLRPNDIMYQTNQVSQALMNQIDSLIRWATNIREFRSLLCSDRIQLLKTYWNELILIDISYRSMSLVDRGIKGLNIYSDVIIIDQKTIEDVSLSHMFERILKELVFKMREMGMDQRELTLLKTIILFNPEAQGLKTSCPIEDMRNLAFMELQTYCNQRYFQTQPNRFAKLLLRLPALRSIGLRCNDDREKKLVFLPFKTEQEIDTYLLKKIAMK